MPTLRKAVSNPWPVTSLTPSAFTIWAATCIDVANWLVPLRNRGASARGMAGAMRTRPPMMTPRLVPTRLGAEVASEKVMAPSASAASAIGVQTVMAAMATATASAPAEAQRSRTASAASACAHQHENADEDQHRADRHQREHQAAGGDRGDRQGDHQHGKAEPNQQPPGVRRQVFACNSGWFSAMAFQKRDRNGEPGGPPAGAVGLQRACLVVRTDIARTRLTVRLRQHPGESGRSIGRSTGILASLAARVRRTAT